MISGLYFKIGHYYSLALFYDFKNIRAKLSFGLKQWRDCHTYRNWNLGSSTGSLRSSPSAAAMTLNPLEGCHPRNELACKQVFMCCLPDLQDTVKQCSAENSQRFFLGCQKQRLVKTSYLDGCWGTWREVLTQVTGPMLGPPVVQQVNTEVWLEDLATEALSATSALQLVPALAAASRVTGRCHTQEFGSACASAQCCVPGRPALPQTSGWR